jgi:predicted acetyltransferase
MSVFHGPSVAEFHAQLDEPSYRPADRLIVKDHDEIVAHVRVSEQSVQLDSMVLPAARFMDLATAPEYRGRGLATALVTTAERAAAEQGALIGLTRTRAPKLFARLGWSVCGRHYYSAAAPRAVLAELGTTASCEPEQPEPPALDLGQDRRQSLAARPLRRIELPALVRLYDQNLVGKFGWPARSEAYWEWLLARGACDRVYIAATMPEPSDLRGLLNSIVGYMFVRQCRIVEVVTAAGREDAASCLLARACADASEEGEWLMRCDTPPGHALHPLFQRARGRIVSSQHHDGELFMAKLLDPLNALRLMVGLLWRRAVAADLQRPAELGIDVLSGDSRGIVERYRLHIGRRMARITTGGPSRHRISVRTSDLASLILGDIGADKMTGSGRLKASSVAARRMAAALFPTGPWWRPPLDDLPV